MAIEDIGEGLSEAEEKQMREGTPAPEEPVAAAPEAPAEEPKAEETPEETPEPDLSKPPSDPPEVRAEKLNKALKESREELKRYRAEHEEFKKRAEGRIDQLFQRVQPPPQEETPEPPDYDTDPIARIKYNEDQRAKTEQRILEQQQQVAFDMALSRADSAGRAQHVDYDKAVEHAVTFMRGKYEDMGMPAERAAQAASNELRGTVVAAMQAGTQAHEFIYKLAGRLGYSAQAQPPNGTPAKAPADEKLEQIKKAQAAAKSLPTGSAPRAGNGVPTPSELIDMDDDDFLEATSGKNWAKIARRA